MLSLNSLSEVYKIIPHNSFPQRTLEKMLAEKKLYTVKKYEGDALDDELDYGYIVKGESSGSNMNINMLDMLKSLSDEVKQIKLDSKRKDAEFNNFKLDAKKKEAEFNNFKLDAIRKETEFNNFKLVAEKEIADLKADGEKKGARLDSTEAELGEMKGKLEIVFKANMLKRAFKYLAYDIALPHISSEELSKYTSSHKSKWESILDCYFDSTLVIEKVPISLQHIKEIWVYYTNSLRETRNSFCHQEQSATIRVEFNTETEEKFLNWYKSETRNIKK